MSVSVKTWYSGEDYNQVIEELNTITDKGINYSLNFSHSAQRLIQRGVIDSYSLLYKDNELISGGGTRPNIMIPDYGHCYMVAVRGFRIPQTGLHQEYFTLDAILPSQIERGKSLGFKYCAMTFNEHNKRLLNNLNRSWNFPREIVQEQKIVNGMPQWIYIF